MGCLGREEDGKQNRELSIILKHRLKAAFIDFQPIGGNVKNSNYMFVVYLTIRAPQCVFIFVRVLCWPCLYALCCTWLRTLWLLFFSGGKYCLYFATLVCFQRTGGALLLRSKVRHQGKGEFFCFFYLYIYLNQLLVVGTVERLTKTVLVSLFCVCRV